MGRTMAHIQKLTDKQRTLPWRAQVRRKGHKVLVKMFATRELLSTRLLQC